MVGVSFSTFAARQFCLGHDCCWTFNEKVNLYGRLRFLSFVRRFFG